MKGSEARIKPALAQAGGSDHVQQSMVVDIGGEAIKIDTHNMLEQCNGRNNAFGEIEGPEEYQARLDLLSAQYANNFTNGTDVLLLQEAPSNPAQAQAMFDAIQANTNTPLSFVYTQNSSRQGMMTIFNTTAVKPAANRQLQEMELNDRVQTTHFEIAGRAVAFKNVHAKFNMGQPSDPNNIAAKQSMEALMQGQPGELIIRAGDHNGGQDFYPDLKFASTGGMPTSSGYNSRTGSFTNDERTGIPKQYDGFAINDSAVALEAQYSSAGALSLNQNKQITFQQINDIGVPQPIAYRSSAEGAIQLKFPTRQDAALFATILYKSNITKDIKQSTLSGDNNNLLLTLTVQEAQDLAKSALLLQPGVQILNQEIEAKTKGGNIEAVKGAPARGIVGGIAGGIAGGLGGIVGGLGGIAGGIFKRIKGIVQPEQEGKQELQQSANKDALPEPINFQRGRTGLIQLEFKDDNEANLFADALHGLDIASNQFGNGPKKSRDSIIRLTADECKALLDVDLLSPQIAESLGKVLKQHGIQGGRGR